MWGDIFVKMEVVTSILQLSSYTHKQVYTYTCIHIHNYTHIHMYAYAHTHTHIQLYTYTSTYTHVRIKNKQINNQSLPVTSQLTYNSFMSHSSRRCSGMPATSTTWAHAGQGARSAQSLIWWFVISFDGSTMVRKKK